MKVTGIGGVPASGVSAVVVNLTVTAPTSGGFISGYADGAAKPGTSNLNFVKGQTVPNLAVLPVGGDGKIRLSNGSAGTVQLIADVSGYYLSKPVPTVNGLSAHSSLVTGGGTMTITGTGFTNVTAVTFDDQPAASYTVVNVNTINAVIPPNAAHTVHVLVTANGGTSAAVVASTFAYTTPADTYQNTLTASTGTFVQSASTVTSVLRNDNTADPAATTWSINIKAGAAAPAVGSRYLLNPGSTVYPSGVFGTITAVSPLNGGNVITVSATSLDDGIQQSSTDFTGPIGDPAAATPASAGPTHIGPQATARSSAPAGTPPLTTTVGFPSISASELLCDSPSASLQGSVSFQLVNVKTHVEANAGGLFTAPFVDVWVSYETKITYSLSAQVATTCKVTPLWQNLHKKVFLIGASPYTISLSPDFSTTLSAAGTISDTEHSYHMSGFISNPDGSIRRIDGKSADPAEVELTGQLQLEFFAGVDIQLGVLDRLGVGITAGIGAKFTAQAATGNPLTACFSANIFLRLTLYAYLDAWVKKWTLQAFQTDLDLPGAELCYPLSTMIITSTPFAADGSLRLPIDPTSGALSGSSCWGGPVTSPGFFDCGTTAASLKQCWREPADTTGAIWVDCLRDPRDSLIQHFQAGTIYVEQVNSDPWSVSLADGLVCTIRTGGAWGPPPSGTFWTFACDGETRALASPANGPLINRSQPVWTALAADPNSNSPVAVTVNVITAHIGGMTPPLPKVTQGSGCPSPQVLATAEGGQQDPNPLTCTSDWATGDYVKDGNAYVGVLQNAGSGWVAFDRSKACTYPGPMPVTLWSAACTSG